MTKVIVYSVKSPHNFVSVKLALERIFRVSALKVHVEHDNGNIIFSANREVSTDISEALEQIISGLICLFGVD